MGLQLGLSTKLVGANTLVILGVVVGGVLLAYNHDTSAGILIVLWSIAGFAATVIASSLILRRYFRPLLELRASLEALQGSAYPSVPAHSNADPTIGGVISSVRDVFHRMEDSSLRHTTRLLNSIEGERQRIGRELHDQTCQTLATALLDLKLADAALDGDPANARMRISAVKQLIELSLEQIKICVYDLRPVMLDDFGLVPTLFWHIRTHLAGTGIAVETDFEDAGMRAPRNIETTLYRIAQEALANILRHARATRVYIRLETRTDHAILTVSDNGIGFDPEQANRCREGRGGLGLRTIRERVKLVNGTLKIESENGRGTKVRVLIPIFPPSSPPPE